MIFFTGLTKTPISSNIFKRKCSVLVITNGSDKALNNEHMYFLSLSFETHTFLSIFNFKMDKQDCIKNCTSSNISCTLFLGIPNCPYHLQDNDKAYASTVSFT